MSRPHFDYAPCNLRAEIRLYDRLERCGNPDVSGEIYEHRCVVVMTATPTQNKLKNIRLNGKMNK